MRKKTLFLCGICFLFPQMLCAQSIEAEMKEFEEFVKQQQKEFSDFVSEQNREFIQFLKENWKSYNSEQTESRPKRPEPVRPVVINKPNPSVKPVHIPIDTIQKIPIVTPKPKPIDIPEENKPVKEKDPLPDLTEKEALAFNFYGIPCKIGVSMKNCIYLKGITEREIADGWEVLSKKDYRTLVNTCLHIKDNYSLNDYAYLMLTQTVATKLLPSADNNSITLLQAFILCQSGYKVKMARIGKELGLLYASTDLIYATTYLTIDGEKYYKWGKKVENGTPIYTYGKNFAESQYMVSMGFLKRPDFNGKIKAKTLQAKKYPNMKVISQVNEDLISFYRNYPQCDFSVYVNAPVSETVEQSAVSNLKELIKGKSQVEAANMLINFVQTAFEYKTDHEQFGYEKPFFVDELFYYPYCDCEDRSVLYSYLVRTLLNLDVVLLDYPNHIATAVCFDEPVEGDYIMLNKKKYLICDPTYIGAPIGLAMPQFKTVAAKILMN